MSNIVKQLADKGLIHPPPWLPTNTMYLTITGSHAYGVADTSVRDKLPDFDVYGFAIPPKVMLFPHIGGHIHGFGTPPSRFEQFQKHHVFEDDALGGVGKEWDFTIFGIVKFFELCRQNNPNMLDSLFTPEECVIHCTQVGQLVRDNRHLFLSKLCWKKFRGYAQSSLKKAQDKPYVKLSRFEKAHSIPHSTKKEEIEAELARRDKQLGRSDGMSLRKLTDKELVHYYKLMKKGGNSQRKEISDKHGEDTKFLYHIIRLFDEAEQILLTGDFDMRRAKDVMKAVRRGDWTAKEVRDWAMEKEKALEVAYVKCELPDKPDEAKLKALLKECLECHYGSLKGCVEEPEWAKQTLQAIDHMLGKVRSKMY